MMERKARKSVVLVAAFALVGMIGIFAVSQAYGDDNTNVQAANANAYSAVPATFSFDFFGEMENVASGISNGNVEVDSAATQNVQSQQCDDVAAQVLEEQNGQPPEIEAVKGVGQLFRDAEIKPRAPQNSPVQSGNNNSSSIAEYAQTYAPQYFTPSSTSTTVQSAPSASSPTVAQAPANMPVEEPVIQNIETPTTPDQQQQQPAVVQPAVENANRPHVIEQPLISKAIEDNVAAAATVTSTEPVIVEKQPTRGASLFGEDGLIAQIVSNPVLRAGIAAFPILIIILIAGFMISRRNEE